jgi:hypothetical protein
MGDGTQGGVVRGVGNVLVLPLSWGFVRRLAKIKQDVLHALKTKLRSRRDSFFILFHSKMRSI